MASVAVSVLNRRRFGYLLFLVVLLSVFVRQEKPVIPQPTNIVRSDAARVDTAPPLDPKVASHGAALENLLPRWQETNATNSSEVLNNLLSSSPVTPTSSSTNAANTNNHLGTTLDHRLPKLPIIPAFNFSGPLENGCEQEYAGQAVYTEFVRNHTDIRDLVNITQRGPDRPRERAICIFQYHGNYLHFPHVYQQFKKLKPYIIRRAHHRFREPFNQGIWNIFKDVFKGTITENLHKVWNNHSVVAHPLYDTGYKEGPYQGITLMNEIHAEELRQKTADFYNMTMGGCQSGKDYPIIGILNREISANRSIVNVDILRDSVQNMTNQPVEISYFEGKEFLEQLQYMMQTDILISPHGAQLTSINFIPACGGVIELYPPGFWFPHFFGPLATSSGLSHGYIYTGKNYYKEWKWGGLRHRWKRFEVRNQNICLPMDTSLSFIGDMVDKWKTCCHERLKEELGSVQGA